MATDRYKVQGYLESDIAERFTAWKKERGIEKDSAALNELLKEYFFKPAPGAAALDPAQIEEIVEGHLEEKFKEFNVFRAEFKIEVWLQLQSLFAIWNQTLQENLSQVNARIDAIEKTQESAEDSPQSPPALSQSELAQRLGCHKSQISRHKDSGDFEAWTRERDPDAIAWNYDPKSKRYLIVK